MFVLKIPRCEMRILDSQFVKLNFAYVASGQASCELFKQGHARPTNIMASNNSPFMKTGYRCYAPGLNSGTELESHEEQGPSMSYQVARLHISDASSKEALPQMLYEAESPHSFRLASKAVAGEFSFSMQTFNGFFTWQGFSAAERSMELRSIKNDFCFKAESRRRYVAKIGRKEIMIGPSSACMTDYSRNTRLEIEAGSEAFGFGISRQSVVEALTKLHGASVPIGFEFDLLVDMSAPHMMTLMNMLSFFQEDARNQQSLVKSPIALALFEDAISMFIVQNFRHSLTNLSAEPPHLIPAQVRRAMDYAVANAGRPISVSDMALAAGVSVRALQVNFQRFLEQSPLEFLREQRLRHAHFELLEAGHEISITEIAEKWGFLHQGRFAAFYRRVYGRLPSQDRGRHVD